MSLGVTLIGRARGDVVKRSGAAPGDAICVTGTLGGSRVGLEILRGAPVDAPARDRLLRRHLRPTARLREGKLLAGAGATAMIDVSDGFALDLWRLLDASACGCIVDPARVPVDPDVAALEGFGIETAIAGGEDFELICTLPHDRVDAARAMVEEIGTSLSSVGVVTAEPDRLVGERRLEELKETGWDHLRDR